MKSNDVVINDVDTLGALRASIADLKKQEKEVEARVRASIDAKTQTAEGVLFKATLVIAFRESLIAEKVREFLHVNQLRAATKVIEVRSLKLTAKEKS